MRHETRSAASAASTLLAVALLTTPAVSASAAASQPEEPRIRREIVVVGSEPIHRRIVLDRIADRGYLGVQLLNLTPELRLHLGAPEESGVLVSRVAPDSPAAAAGIAVGDVITSAGGGPVSTAGQLVGRVGHRREGEEIDLGIVRDGTPLTVRATLAQSERRQMEVGQFVWRTGGEEPLVLDLDAEAIERVIAVDPATINESVSQLLRRLEDQGGAPGGLRLEDDQRRQLEERIAELERRLREMERRLHRRHQGD